MVLATLCLLFLNVFWADSIGIEELFLVDEDKQHKLSEIMTSVMLKESCFMGLCEVPVQQKIKSRSSTALRHKLESSHVNRSPSSLVLWKNLFGHLRRGSGSWISAFALHPSLLRFYCHFLDYTLIGFRKPDFPK